MYRYAHRLIVTLAVLLPGVPALADENDFYCGGTIIERGMTQADVLQHCGPPTSKATQDVPVRSGNRVVGTTQNESWTYSSYSRTRVLQFDGDRLVAIN